MSAEILFCGDTSLATAAAYLGGCLSYFGWDFDYIPTGTRLTVDHLSDSHRLVILSDYAAADVSDEVQQQLADQIAAGAGLLMIGGWESFQGWNGSAGGWHGSIVGDLLPVEIAREDDRQNCDQPTFVVPRTLHEILRDLPWEERPPLIGGYNRVIAKSHTKIILEARRTLAQLTSDEQIELIDDGSDPLLVIDDSALGRRACLMTDLAPHWVGPFVDWGSDRVSAQAPGGDAIEVGCDYARFVRQLIEWTGRF